MPRHPYRLLWRGKSHDKIHALLTGFGSLQLQEQDRQKIHKLSYYLPLQVNPTVLIENIQQQLQKHQILANLVWSIDELAGNGLLDILPASASKRHAIEFLMQQLQFDINETVFIRSISDLFPVVHCFAEQRCPKK